MRGGEKRIRPASPSSLDDNHGGNIGQEVVAGKG
jgi:hypothetical protein